MCGACDWQNCIRSHRGLFRRIWNPDLFFLLFFASTSAKRLFIVTMATCSFSYHLSLYTFFFYLGNRSTHLTGNFFHTCTENTSLFVFGTVQKKLYTVAKKGRSPEMTSAQSTAADPNLLHLVRFSFSINKCFHIFTFYSPSLSLRHTKYLWITEDDVLQSRADDWEQRGSRCIFHEALDAVLFMPLTAAVLFFGDRAPNNRFMA